MAVDILKFAIGTAGTVMDHDETIEGGDYLPPRKSDTLFAPDIDWQTKAYAASGLDDIIYQEGYRQAARILVRSGCDQNGILHFPIIYLYRHHIELTLKSMIQASRHLLDRTFVGKSDNPLQRHGLLELWMLARPLLDEVHTLADNTAIPADDLEGIESYITQLHLHDPQGQCFRYPTTKNGRPSLRSGVTPLDIKKFSDALEKLADYLEGIDNWLGDLIEAKAAYLAKYDIAGRRRHDSEDGP